MFGATAAKTRLPLSRYRRACIRMSDAQFIGSLECEGGAATPTSDRRSTIDRRLIAIREADWLAYALSLRRHGNRLAGKSAAGFRSRGARGGSGCGLSSAAIISPVEMPGGVAEQRDHDRKAEEERQRSHHQQHRDDQAPCRHRHRIARHRAQRRHHGFAGAGMTVEHQRERHHADAERDQRRTGSRRRSRRRSATSLAAWSARASRNREYPAARFVTERCDVDRLRGRDPGHEQRQQQRRRARAWRRTRASAAPRAHPTPTACSPRSRRRLSS